MEETKPRSGLPGDRAQVAAEKLRALRDRANQALDDHRRRLSQIESELGLRVRQLAEEFETASQSAKRGTQNGDDEVAALRRQLEEGRAKHEKFVEQLAVARKQLDAIQSQPCPACQDAAHQLADAQGEIRQLCDQLDAAERQRDEDRARHEKFAEQVAAARQAINDLQSTSGDQAGRLQAELEIALAGRADAESQVTALDRDMAALHAEYDALQAGAQGVEEEFAARLEDFRCDAEAAASVAAEKHAARVAELEEQIQSVRAAHKKVERESESLGKKLAETEKERATLLRQRDDLQRDKAQLETTIAGVEAAATAQQQALAARAAIAEEKQIELRDQLANAQCEKASVSLALAESTAEIEELHAALAAAQRQIETLEQSSDAAVDLEGRLASLRADAAAQEQKARQLHTSLDRAQAELAGLRESTCPRDELDALQQKFDLALADVQKLKHESGELREVLATRPAASDLESPELVALRLERDQLAARITELENAVVTAAGAASQQDVEDLNRRFEMAVDDVRELKQENAGLRDQLAKAKLAPAEAAPHNGPLDWAAQRARLMASLQEEDADGAPDAARQKERVKIDHAIETTERIVAEKDREIAELRAAQQVHGSRAARDDDRRRDVEAILDADEVIAQERQRLAQLEAEWESKLRAAELEFAVERAKLAREQSAVKERHFELEKLQQQAPTAEVDHAKPRRRWRTALGLGEEGDEPAKGK